MFLTSPGRRDVSRLSLVRQQPVALFIGFVVVPAFHVVNRALSLDARALCRRLGHAAPERATAKSEPWGDPQLVARALHIGARVWRVADRSCLARALTLWVMLQRRGWPAEVWVGFDPVEAAHGHAWVEIDGEVIGDSSDVGDRYPAFDAPYLARDDRPT